MLKFSLFFQKTNAGSCLLQHGGYQTAFILKFSIIQTDQIRLGLSRWSVATKALLLRDQGGNDGKMIDKKDLHNFFFEVLVFF